MAVNEIQILRTRLEYLERLINALGLPTSPWVTPTNAAAIISTSRSTIMNEIERAEEARISKRDSDLAWGTHYRKTGTHWQVNPIELEKVIFLPPESRPY
ncbi:hypothetical protein U2F10_03210 [Leptothoe sp. EHU-05/26/07-4]